MSRSVSEYHYGSPDPGHTAAYLWPTVLDIVDQELDPGSRIFDLGCGNGAFAARLREEGYQIVGVDPSAEGIEQGRRAHPGLELHQGSTDEDLAGRFGTFPLVVSLEVIEHVYAPRDFARTVHELLEPGGVAIVSTPYHGYLKNLVLALTGRMDRHFTALWDHGHIKFWSRNTFRELFEETGFRDLEFHRVGRTIPSLAKSMIAVARKGSPGN